MDTPLMAAIILFAGNFAPRDWMFCDGQILAISTNTALFSLLGTTYGGNGQTTFALPDLRGRVPVHAGNSAGPGLTQRVLGETGGVENVTLTVNQMPLHTHSFPINASTAVGNTNIPTGAIFANTGATDKEYTNAAPNTTLANGSTFPAGGNTPLTVMQPYLALNFCIAIYGIYPSRN